MKIIGEIDSRRGHKEIDYVVRISPIELKTIKALVCNVPGLTSKNNKMKSAHVSLRKSLGIIKL